MMETSSPPVEPLHSDMSASLGRRESGTFSNLSGRLADSMTFYNMKHSHF